jgi:hypothetical protein
MLAKTRKTKPAFDLNRMKSSVEGNGSEVAITLKGKMSPNEIIKALMNVKTTGLSS